MKIGELAKESDISVRTLHHYDEIGLLAPSTRDASGHRHYNKDDVIRLHRILSLKKLCLTLEEIRDVIGKSNSQIKTLLDRNVERLETEVEEKKSTLRILKGTRQFLDVKTSVELPELVDLIKDISLAHQYFNEPQLCILEEREELAGDKAVSAIFSDLARIKSDLRKALDQNLPATNEKVLVAVKRWAEIADTLVGDNEDIKNVAQKMIDENPEILERNQLTDEMVEFARSARKHLEDRGELGKHRRV